MREPARPVFCLIVENDLVIGLDLADSLPDGRWYVAGPFRCGREVLKWLTRFTPDVAILDPMLRNGMSDRILGALQARGVPFVIHTDGEAKARVPDSLSGVPWLEKPSSPAKVKAVLAALLPHST
jgi:DNA-binding response OmpR family regulator